jgi:integrase
MISLCVKGGKAFVQSVDPDFIPVLKRFLDGIGLHGLSVHGLRVSWATRAALSGVPLAVTLQYLNHSNQLVHQVYTQVAARDVNQFFSRLK